MENLANLVHLEELWLGKNKIARLEVSAEMGFRFLTLTLHTGN